MIYPTTTYENENMFTTDPVSIYGDFTTLDSSETIQEGETLPKESRIGSVKDGIIFEEGSSGTTLKYQFRK